MRWIVTIMLILVIGGLVLWEAISWGTRTWVKYGLMKEPLPSLTTLLPRTSVVPLIITTLLIVLLIAIASAVIRSRRLLGVIPVKELRRHVIILGPTGSGKTTMAKDIVRRAVGENVKVTIIDWKGEYVPFLENATVIRKIPCLWDVPGDSPREKALMATEMIREIGKDVIEVSPPSALLLLKVLEEEYRKGVPTTEKIVKMIEKNAEIAQREGRYAESNMYLALVRRLFILLVDEERKAENVLGSSELVVYDLGSLPSIHLKTLYANYVLMTIYREATKAKKAKANGLRTIVVAEEAQNYIFARRPGETPSIAERTVYELRSFGVGVVLVCPDSELLPQPVLKDVAVIVSMGADSLPRFALERFLFRASLKEAEDTLKKLKKAKAIVYYRGQLHFLRRLPKPPRILKPRPKGDRMGFIDLGVDLLRAWPILPHRSPGRPKVIEVKEGLEEKPKVVEVKEESIVEKLRLEPEELEEVEEPAEPIEKEAVEEAVEVKEEKEPAPKGPPIPSSLPYRGSLCPAGRSATLGRVLF